jgi:hypothetical protein
MEENDRHRGVLIDRIVSFQRNSSGLFGWLD